MFESPLPLRNIMKVIGFEGTRCSTYGLTYGAAAVEKDGQVYNAVTGKPCRWKDYEEYLEDGTVTAIPSMHIPPPLEKCPLMVVHVGPKCYAGQLIALCLHAYCLGYRADEDLNYYYIVSGMESISDLAKRVVPELEKLIGRVDSKMVASLILTLDHKNEAALKLLFPNINFSFLTRC